MNDRILDKYINMVRNLHEEAPVNSVGGGNIAGTREAGDDPPIRRKKKYIYQKGLRKWWTSLTK